MNAVIMIEKNKHKIMTERILKHSLQIIYLLTGEEYSIVKKNLPHRSICHLAGESADTVVSLSMEVWEQKGYKKVVNKNHKTLSHSTCPPQESPGTSNEKHSMVPKLEQEDDLNVRVNQQVKEEKIPINISEYSSSRVLRSLLCRYPAARSPMCHASVVSSTTGIQTLAKERPIPPGAWRRLEFNHGQMDGQTQNTDKTPNYTGDPEEYGYTVSINEEGEYVREEKVAEQMKINKDESLSTEMIDHKATCSSMNMVEIDTFHLSNIKEENCERNTLKEFEADGRSSSSHNAVCDQPEQNSCTLNNSFVKDYTDAAYKVACDGQQVSCSIEKPYGCSDCQKCFSTKTHLIRHHKIHTGEKPHACFDCDKRFITRSQLIRHQRTHTGEKPHACFDCGKSFITRSHLVIHQRSHTGEKPYACFDCEKCFITQAQLVIHQRTHTGEKPYVCSVCRKGFSQRPSLVKHHRTHTGEKPYVCQICGIGFSVSSNLVAHQRTHTGEKICL